MDISNHSDVFCESETIPVKCAVENSCCGTCETKRQALSLVRLLARLHHLSNDLHQGSVLQSGRDSLLIPELLVDLVAGTMGPLLNPHVYPEAWREGLF